MAISDSEAATGHFHSELFLRMVVRRILQRLVAAGLLGNSGGEVSDASFAWLSEYRCASGPETSSDDGSAADPFEEVVTTYENSHSDWLPMRQLERTDALLIAAAGLIEEDIRFGSLFAKLQEPLAARRPCLGVLGWLLANENLGPSEVVARGHDLARSGLLLVDNPADPRSEWVVRVPIAIWDLLRRGAFLASSLPLHLEFRAASSFPELESVIVPQEVVGRLPRICDLLQSGQLPVVVARGPETSGRLTVLGAIARRVGLDVLVHDGTVGDDAWQLLGPLAMLAGAMAVVVARPGPGETLAVPAFRAISTIEQSDARRPVMGVVIGRHGGLSGPALDGALSITIGGGEEDDRRRMWLEGGLRAEEAELRSIVQRALLTPGNIRRAAPVAMAVAALDGRDHARASDVHVATRTLSREVLETLATYLPPLDPAVRPVLGPAASEELGTLLSLCRQRDHLPHYAGAAAHGTLNRGVRALFSGPSGTGKTLAGRYIAAQLGLDLYRVDLAAVVSKYIGETERNLDQVLGRAEELDVILLLDEGDALMTRRTEVASSNDRYANLETNFLLQRLETFEGIAIVTSNASSRIDQAFQRRIDVTVELTPPDAEARYQIWLAHLPGDNTVSPQFLEEVARRCNLTGGQVRNAALHACLLALETERPVDDGLLFAAVRREHRRMGAPFPLQAVSVR